MFTCDFEAICRKREIEAKKEHHGNARGIKLLIRKITWHPWIRSHHVCHSGCDIWNGFHQKKFAKFIKKNAEAIKKVN